MNNMNLIDDERIPIQSLILTARIKHVITESEFKEMVLDGFEPAAMGPEHAYKLARLRLMKKKRNPNYRPDVLSEQVVTVTTRSELELLPKLTNMTATFIEQEAVLDGEVREFIAVDPISCPGNQFCKSIVLDAREIDPEIVTDVTGQSEIETRVAEVIVQIKTTSTLTFSYTYSGYDKSLTVKNVRQLRQRAAEHMSFVLSEETSYYEARIIVHLRDVRQFYTFKNFKHKKFLKYNPRQYCYFTLYVLGDGAIGNISMFVKRISLPIDEPCGLIYRGPEIRKGRERMKFEHYRYSKKKV